MARAERDRALLEIRCIDGGRPLVRQERAELAQAAATGRILVADQGRPAAGHGPGPAGHRDEQPDAARDRHHSDADCDRSLPS